MVYIVWWSMEEYGRVWWSMAEYGRVWSSMVGPTSPSPMINSVRALAQVATILFGYTMPGTLLLLELLILAYCV